MRHLMRDAIRKSACPTVPFTGCVTHSRAIELGIDWQTIERIVGHRTAEMAHKYTPKRRRARLAIATLDAAQKPNRRRDGVKTAANLSENHPNRGGLK
jgi:hypothetical protein